MKTIFGWALAISLALSSFAGDIWRLGIEDGSSRDFRPYHAWEYGREAWVAKSPSMNVATQTWTYRVPGRGLQKHPSIPCSLVTRYENFSMPDNEVVSGLRLVWTEPAPTNRLFTIACSGYSHHLGNGVRGIEIVTEEGFKKLYNLPRGGVANKKGCFPMEAVLPVHAGTNSVTVRIATLAKHYAISFDSIALQETTRQPSFDPILEAKTDLFSGIAHPGETAHLLLTQVNCPTGDVLVVVRSANSNVVCSATERLTNGRTSFLLPIDRKGWFSVSATCGKASVSTAYAVVEPPNDEFVDDSRFGCHALAGDGYFLRDTALCRERAELKARRAYLGGAKWARLHYLSWACREPERGKFVWDGLDQRVALAERNKMRVMFNVVEVPRWNSPTNDMSLTVCGAQRFKMYPPVDSAAWATFVSTLVSRYQGRVNDFEIGNEPGFTSAFWMTGSPKDFADYLATAYAAAHAANPSCRIYPGAPLDTIFFEDVLKAASGRPCYDILSGHYQGNGQRFSSKTSGWLALNAAYGKPKDMINSEDMGWRSEVRHGQTAVAANMVKLHVRDAVRGIRRTFAFQIFDDLAGLYSFFDSTDSPYVAFPAYRTMTHRLEYARYAGDLSTAEVEAYVFDRKGVPVIVFWNDLKVPFDAALNLGQGQVTAIDEMDNERRMNVASDGLCRLPAANLPRYVEGGDWTAIRAAIAARPKDPFANRKGNPLGVNMATKRLENAPRYTHRRFFDVASAVPVNYGEQYVLSAEIRGHGELHGIITVWDRDGKELYPCRQGLNCLGKRADGEAWQTVSQVVSISWEGAAKMRLVLVPNFYSDNKGALEIRNVIIARVSETYSASKALHHGTFGTADYGAPIVLPGATARVKLGPEGIFLLFDVEDETFDHPKAMPKAYEKDSIQFALDPKNDGTDCTEFMLGRLASGETFLYKLSNYVTPELPDNLTRHGEVRSGKVTWTTTQKGYRMEVQIPLREVYPLKADAKEFGFDYLVNDNDGKGRRYVEWTPGIGGAKSAADFGSLQRR